MACDLSSANYSDGILTHSSIQCWSICFELHLHQWTTHQPWDAYPQIIHRLINLTYTTFTRKAGPQWMAYPEKAPNHPSPEYQGGKWCLLVVSLYMTNAVEQLEYRYGACKDFWSVRAYPIVSGVGCTMCILWSGPEKLSGQIWWLWMQERT